MSEHFFILGLVWFFGTLKYVLFWIYLWQLKEYHIGRFRDHFSTSKGKKLIFSWFLAFKIILFIFLILPSGFANALYVILVLTYFGESVLFLRQIQQQTFKKPVKTAKALFLTAVSVIVIIVFLFWAQNMVYSWLLIFDILLPAIISAIVLFFQPFFVFLRNKKISEAGQKLEKFKNLKIIAITGSFGKTSTKEFLTTILSEKFKVLSTNKHQNSEIGIANCILNDLNKEHQIFIAEVGAYNKGKVKEVCGILKPKIGMVTGVNEQHMALFGSLDNLLSAEGGRELDESLVKDGFLILNGDNKYCLDLAKRSNNIIKIYTEKNKNINADIWTENISVGKNFISFLAHNRKGELANFSVQVLGKQNVQNLLGAILAANELGMSFAEISEAVKNIKEEQAGMTLEIGKHGINVIDSSYSSNPDGVYADLDYLSVFPGKKVVVMPCLIELGKNAGYIHEQIGKKIGKTCDLAIITSKDYFEQIEKGCNEVRKYDNGTDILRRSSATNVVKCILCDKSQDIYSIITIFCKSGDAVLLEGRVPGKLIELLK